MEASHYFSTFLTIILMLGQFRHGLTPQGNVAMKKAPLEDEAQYAGTAHPLLLPPCAEKQEDHSEGPELEVAKEVRTDEIKDNKRRVDLLETL